MELNIKEAAAFAKVARSTLYGKIRDGELSKNANGKIDTAELLRVFGEPKRHVETTQLDAQKDTENTLKIQVTMLEKANASLERQLSKAEDREKQANERADALMDTIKALEYHPEPKVELPKKPWGLIIAIALAVAMATIVAMQNLQIPH